MAAKHDGKKARENMWVTHQNLARAKGGQPGYQFKERVPPKPTAPKPSAKPAVPAPGAEPAVAEAPAATPPVSSTSDAKE